MSLGAIAEARHVPVPLLAGGTLKREPVTRHQPCLERLGPSSPPLFFFTVHVTGQDQAWPQGACPNTGPVLAALAHSSSHSSPV